MSRRSSPPGRHRSRRLQELQWVRKGTVASAPAACSALFSGRAPPGLAARAIAAVPMPVVYSIENLPFTSRAVAACDDVPHPCEFRGLVEEPACAGGDAQPPVQRIRIIGENDDRGGAPGGADLAQDVEPRAAAKVVVENDAVGPAQQD